jgi:hypothetical protein
MWLSTTKKGSKMSKGPGRYSRKSNKTNLEARTEAYENALRTCKGKQAGGFHKPGSNKK